jgi:hypothetical protein
MGLIKRVSAATLKRLSADKLGQLRQVDEHNTNLMSGYRNQNFVGLKMWPIVTARKESGKFTEFGPSPFVDKEKLKTSLGSKRVRLDFTTATGSYVTNRFEVDVPIYDRELEEIADSDLDSFVEAKTMLGQDVSQLAMEYYVASIAGDPTQYAAGFSQTNAGATQWKQTTSTPLADLRAAVRKVALQVGRPYSDLAIAVSPKGWEALSDHAQIQAKIQYGAGPNNPSVVTQDALAKIFGVGHVDILSAQYPVTIDPLDPTATVFAFLWADVCIVYLPIDKPSFASPLWGAIIRKEGYPYVDEYRDNSIDAQIKVARDNWGTTIRANNRAYCISAASGL